MIPPDHQNQPRDNWLPGRRRLFRLRYLAPLLLAVVAAGTAWGNFRATAPGVPGVLRNLDFFSLRHGRPFHPADSNDEQWGHALRQGPSPFILRARTPVMGSGVGLLQAILATLSEKPDRQEHSNRLPTQARDGEQTCNVPV